MLAIDRIGWFERSSYQPKQALRFGVDLEAQPRR
jgi:hypothetical protein